MLAVLSGSNCGKAPCPMPTGSARGTDIFGAADEFACATEAPEGLCLPGTATLDVGGWVGVVVGGVVSILVN